MADNYHYCPFCAMPLAKLKNDKKGRPYSNCDSCAARLFMKSERAYKGYVRLAEEAQKQSEPRLRELLAAQLPLTTGGFSDGITTRLKPEPKPEPEPKPKAE